VLVNSSDDLMTVTFVSFWCLHLKEELCLLLSF